MALGENNAQFTPKLSTAARLHLVTPLQNRVRINRKLSEGHIHESPGGLQVMMGEGARVYVESLQADLVLIDRPDDDEMAVLKQGEGSTFEFLGIANQEGPLALPLLGEGSELIYLRRKNVRPPHQPGIESGNGDNKRRRSRNRGAHHGWNRNRT